MKSSKKKPSIFSIFFASPTSVCKMHTLKKNLRMIAETLKTAVQKNENHQRQSIVTVSHSCPQSCPLSVLWSKCPSLVCTRPRSLGSGGSKGHNQAMTTVFFFFFFFCILFLLYLARNNFPIMSQQRFQSHLYKQTWRTLEKIQVSVGCIFYFFFF